MHEMSVALHLLAQLEALAEEHGANAVTEIELSVGALQGVVPEALDLAFSAAAEGTIAGGATLVITEVSAEALCRACGQAFSPDVGCYVCPSCGAADARITQGNEILLTSLECKCSEDN
ncbi:MAG: hydrogenase maturation nickel metallochaperone HypA [Lentisphaerae bacterium]|jgi:hydrogenase nickel incorporation protein HypA/HybF|nr:hydrogenase maturation nickel metallochaperone HypA [Lentisphaerota bacterium]MBT4819574.1 hydrogenase maturation nickel metallochaperone HypA [Lentisphaerota bacterium]MBT5609662.1 hydrogenase maturation nickel metallochaperone HypA [Lentisphaerota bacterium]MBT7055262.1 hydrogenase maturation nickel metallochaperone HypA [Lentisphaerota bacterium]MBT7841390.1 hydrogenase maturation nickel metallochaperone HypA [Lentisphaerota bacterium]